MATTAIPHIAAILTGGVTSTGYFCLLNVTVNKFVLVTFSIFHYWMSTCLCMTGFSKGVLFNCCQALNCMLFSSLIDINLTTYYPLVGQPFKQVVTSRFSIYPQCNLEKHRSVRQAEGCWPKTISNISFLTLHLRKNFLHALLKLCHGSYAWLNNLDMKLRHELILSDYYMFSLPNIICMTNISHFTRTLTFSNLKKKKFSYVEVSWLKILLKCKESLASKQKLISSWSCCFFFSPQILRTASGPIQINYLLTLG